MVINNLLHKKERSLFIITINKAGSTSHIYNKKILKYIEKYLFIE